MVKETAGAIDDLPERAIEDDGALGGQLPVIGNSGCRIDDQWSINSPQCQVCVEADVRPPNARARNCLSSQDHQPCFGMTLDIEEIKAAEMRDQNVVQITPRKVVAADGIHIDDKLA